MDQLVDVKWMVEELLKNLDFSCVRFPSDALTLGTVRKIHQKDFDLGYDPAGNAQPRFFLKSGHAGQVEDVLGSMLYIERTLAATAFCRAAGITPPDVPYDDFKDDLADLYVKHGIGTGRHQCEELFRNIEAQGIAMFQGLKR